MKNEMKTRISGIYAILYRGQIIYIGQSENIYNRIKQHFKLTQNVKKLVEQQDKNGYLKDWEQLSLKKNLFIAEFSDDISWEILELCEVDDLDLNEKYWIEKYKPIFNYEGVVTEYHGQRRRQNNFKVEEGAWEDDFFLDYD